jgi:CubicO group peptidase (beta-lactamase class C family)
VPLEPLESTLRAERARLSVPGFALALRRGGETEVIADGVADLADSEPVTRETAFRIASITKPFVGALSLAFAADGLIDLDATLSGWATARQLLSHQGGLASEWPVSLDRYGDGDDALLKLAEDKPSRLPVEPGELWSYSNAGYWLVGAAIARAAKTTFERAMRGRLVGPLGLSRTRFEATPPAARGHEQVAPDTDEHRPVDDAYPRVRRPSGGLWSTVDDLLVFAALLEEQTELQQPLVATPEGQYGLGVHLREVRGRRIVEHAGSAAGFQSLLLIVPAEGLVLAALTNSSRGRLVIQRALELLELAPLFEPRRRPDEELEPFAGRYRDDWLDGSVQVERGGLRIEVTYKDPFTRERVEFPPVWAEPVGPREFRVVGGDAEGDVVDFPRPHLGRFGGLVVPRVGE